MRTTFYQTIGRNGRIPEFDFGNDDIVVKIQVEVSADRKEEAYCIGEEMERFSNAVAEIVKNGVRHNT